MILQFQFALQHIMITAKTTANMLLNNHLITRKHAIIEHRKKRKTRKSKLKLGKTLAEIAETADFTINFQL